jgi:hypothetical protein
MGFPNKVHDIQEILGVLKVHDPGIHGIYKDIKPKPWHKYE